MRQQIRAVQKISAFGSALAAPLLVQALEATVSSDVLSVAFQSLTHFGFSGVGAVAEMSMAKLKPQRRIQLIGLIIQHWVGDVKLQQYAAQILTVACTASDPKVVEEALGGLRQLRCREGAMAIGSIAASPCPMRETAIQALASQEPSVGLPILLKLLEDNSLEVRVAAVEALRQMDTSPIRQKLLGLLNHFRLDVALEAIYVMSSDGLRDETRALKYIFRNAEAHYSRCAAGKALRAKGWLPTQDLDKIWMFLANGECEAAAFVGPGALPLLAEYAKSQAKAAEGSFEVTEPSSEYASVNFQRQLNAKLDAIQRTIFAMASLGDASVEHLRRLVDLKEFGVAGVVARGLGRTNSPRAIPVLMEVLANAPNEVIAALTAMPNEVAIAALATVVNNDEHIIREKAFKALCIQLSSDVLTDRLLELLKRFVYDSSPVSVQEPIKELQQIIASEIKLILVPLLYLFAEFRDVTEFKTVVEDFDFEQGFNPCSFVPSIKVNCSALRELARTELARRDKPTTIKDAISGACS